MPKASAPPIVGPIDLRKYAITLDETEKSEIARALGLARLSDESAAALQDVISVYKATLAEPIQTTPHASIAAISDVQRISKSLVKALARFTNERSGVDGETFDGMHPYATAVVTTLTAFDLAAAEEKKRLKAHSRVYADQECLRQLCAGLRMLFFHFAEPGMCAGETARGPLRQFALEVFTIAGIDHADFASHPERLDELLEAEFAQ
jgi:hypothetical protein